MKEARQVIAEKSFCEHVLLGTPCMIKVENQNKMTTKSMIMFQQKKQPNRVCIRVLSIDYLEVIRHDLTLRDMRVKARESGQAENRKRELLFSLKFGLLWLIA